MTVEGSVPFEHPSPQILPQDVRFGYQLVLGREPETAEVIEIKRGHRPVELFRDLLTSDEFINGVVDPLRRGEMPNEHLFAGRPDPAFASWVREFLPLSRGGGDAAARASSWPRALAAVVADPEFGRWDGLEGAHWRDGDFLSRLRRWSASLDRKIVAHLDFVSRDLVRGWAIDELDPDEPVALVVAVDGAVAATALTGQRRSDIGARYGSRGAHGFEIDLDLEGRFVRASTVQLVVRDADTGRALAQAEISLERQTYLHAIEDMRVEVGRLERQLANLKRLLPDIAAASSFPIAAYGEYFDLAYASPWPGQGDSGRRVAELSQRPLFSVVVPTFETDQTLLEQALRSVLRQAYPVWELIVSDDGSNNAAQSAVLVDRLRQEDGGERRIVWLPSDERAGVSVATNRALAEAKGDYVAFLDHDDLLAWDALLCMAEALQRQPEVLVLYSDEDRLVDEGDGVARHHDPHLKPSFDPILLTQTNYMCHLLVVRADLCRTVGGWNPDYDGAQDYDFILRAVEAAGADAILHIPRILYHWRVTTGSLSRDPSRIAAINQRTQNLVARHLGRTGRPGTVRGHRELFGTNRDFVVRIDPADLSATSVTIIVPTRDRLDLLRPCVEAVIRARNCSAMAVDLIVIDNGSVDAEAVSYLRQLDEVDGVAVARDEGPFNWAALNNAAASRATGDVLLFLNNDVVPIGGNWCDELCFWALQQDVGAVGARLVLADGRLQHAGAVLSPQSITRHEGYGMASGDPGFLGRHLMVHSVSAVTGACLATRREVFVRLGGFDAESFPVICNDTDYCLRARASGLAVVYTPHAVLYHFESVSRGSHEDDCTAAASVASFRARWQDRLADDPFYNPHFVRDAAPFTRLKPLAALPPTAMIQLRER